MGIVDKITNLLPFTKSSSTANSLQFSSELFTRSLATLAENNTVNADSVLQNPTAFAAIDTLAKTIAQQPFQVIQAGEVVDAYPSGILARPNEDTTSYEAKYQMVIDLMSYGSAFIETRRSRNGTVQSWRVIPPQMIRVQRDVNGRTVLTLDPRGAESYQFRIENIVIENVTMIRDVISSKVPRGVPRVELVKRLVALDNAIDRFGTNLFNRSLQVGSHVIVIPDILRPEQVDEIYQRMKEQYGGVGADGAGGTPVLEGGVDIKPITPIKPTDADMSALKQRTMAQITAVFGVPAALIELNNGNANYNNVQQRYAGFYRDTVGPLSTNITQKLDRAFSLPPQVGIRLDATELLKGDFTNQVNVATSAYRNGYWTLNEARMFTGQSSVSDGDSFMEVSMPGNTTGTQGDSGVEDENN